MKFVEKHFGKKKPEVNDVLEKLTSMEKQGESRVRLKMVVLYFLAVVIKGRQKSVGGAIEDFLLRVVDDLNLCKSFPWGRYTFDDCLYHVYKMVDKQKTRVTATQCLPGFVLPLEVLAFECIEPLKSRFREAVEPVDSGCPILCRGKFKNRVLKGFSLQELYEELGDSKAINSTVVYEGEAEDVDITPQDLFVDNPIVDGWNEIITRNGKIFWEDFHQIDIDARKEDPVPPEADPVIPDPDTVLPDADPVLPDADPVLPDADTVLPGVAEVMKILADGFQKIDEKIKKMDEKIDEKMADLNGRLLEVENRLFNVDMYEPPVPAYESPVPPAEPLVPPAEVEPVPPAEVEPVPPAEVEPVPPAADPVPPADDPVPPADDPVPPVEPLEGGRKRQPSRYNKSPYVRMRKKRNMGVE